MVEVLAGWGTGTGRYTGSSRAQYHCCSIVTLFYCVLGIGNVKDKAERDASSGVLPVKWAEVLKGVGMVFVRQ